MVVHNKRNSFAKCSYCIYSGVPVIQKCKQMIQCKIKMKIILSEV